MGTGLKAKLSTVNSELSILEVSPEEKKLSLNPQTQNIPTFASFHNLNSIIMKEPKDITPERFKEVLKKTVLNSPSNKRATL